MGIIYYICLGISPNGLRSITSRDKIRSVMLV